MERAKRTLLVSTGTMVGRSNGFNYRRALREIAVLQDKTLCAGAEIMMLPFYYDKIADLTRAVREAGVRPVTIHCEKDVGTLLSDAALLDAEGKSAEADETCAEAFRLFRLNCETAAGMDIGRMVLHLWGGIHSDQHIAYNVAHLPALNEMAKSYGVRILCENIPSNHDDPRTNWHRILPYIGEGGLIFDTRFGQLHEQIRETLTDAALLPYIEHIHISDFAGKYREFSALRPILHPGEGSVHFDEVAELLDAIPYSGTITLESPVMEGENINTVKLEQTLSYLRTLLL